MNLAVNKPERLTEERARILAQAAGVTPAAAARVYMERAERMARFVRKGKVLES